MPRYRVVGTVIGGKYLGEFEAESAEAAIELAIDSDAATVNLCHQCSGECENPEINGGVADLIDEKGEE